MSPSSEPSAWYDVAIVGAGPAGLSLAAELSKTHLVALIEKERIRGTRKAWCILELDGFRADDAHVLNRMAKGTIRLRDGSDSHDFSRQMKDGEGCALIDENRVMEGWIAIARENRCRFFEKTAFVEFAYLAEGVRLRTTGEEIKAKLVVDASGYNSPILRKLGLDTRTDFLVPTYGGYIDQASFADSSNALGLVMDSSTPIYAEYFPISEETGCAWIFRILPQEKFVEKSERDWIGELRHNYSSVVAKDPEVSRSRICLERYGVIPMKKGQRKAADRILLVGDAGGSTPFSTLGFNRIYKNYRSTARQISDRLEEGELSGRSLNEITFNDGNRFSDVVGPMMIQTMTKLGFHDVLRVTRKIRQYDLFEEFVDLQAHAADNSVRLEHVLTFGRKLMRRPLSERLDTLRTSYGFLSARDGVQLGYAVGKAYLGARHLRLKTERSQRSQVDSSD